MNELNIFDWARTTDNTAAIVPAFVDWLLTSPTPERVQLIRDRLSDEGVGIVARGVLERLLGTKNGEHDFSRFPERFRALPMPFLKALFGPGFQGIQDIAITSEALFPR